MPLPQPEDFADRIRALEQAVRDLRSSITNAGGQTTASAGWAIGNASPPTPSSGGHLYASGDEPYWKDASGSVNPLITPPSPPASAPNWPESFDSPASIGSAPTASDYNLLRSDCAGLHDDLRSVILRGVDFGAWLDPS